MKSILAKFFPEHDTPTVLAILVLFFFAVTVVVYTLVDANKHGYVETAHVYTGLFFGGLSAAVYVFGKRKGSA